ncbi:MAG: hypothetical protein HY303_12085 [Candidatus Wallbacteria bacterium]|nr:hypothetical protein [Candidatus Wallbacteria bacterium]
MWIAHGPAGTLVVAAAFREVSGTFDPPQPVCALPALSLLSELEVLFNSGRLHIRLRAATQRQLLYCRTSLADLGIEEPGR